jgi:hypothetical protein
MARNKDNYKPQAETKAILDRAWELVNSVPYQVSARWLFYGLLQEGYYTSKGDYKNKFMKAISNARHANYGDWRPDTLADDTREAVYRGHGHRTPNKWIIALAEDIECHLSVWHEQAHYIELWFEARAMAQQFEYYTQHITLRPMGGEPSIPYKFDTAKFLESAYRTYQKPITVLYFGDLDKKGLAIAQTVRKDVQKWCSINFDFVHCGLNLEQVQRYNVPQNFEKPGTYQWEALSDTAAREIIESNVSQFVRHDAFSKVMEQQDAATAWLREQLSGLSDKYGAA